MLPRPALQLRAETTSPNGLPGLSTIATVLEPEFFVVGVDGIDGSGKSTFADEVGVALSTRGVSVVRSTIDSFHLPRASRWRRGRTSPLGFYLDSHDLDSVRSSLLEPFAAGVGNSFVPAVFDEASDQPTDSPPSVVGHDEVLIFDGIFVQRPELAAFWDVTVFLDGCDRVALGRLGYVFDGLPEDAVDAATTALEWSARIDRYASGMRYYIDLIDPKSTCDILIDNNHFASPRVLRNEIHPDA